MMNFLNRIGIFEMSWWLTCYRQKRMAEMREFQSKSRFGTVGPLTKPDFLKEVTEASATTWVFVHLFKD